ncbi:hypothetical protein IV203_009610 [Nitzschia inconspicua]|uniref:Uncharacterized protein n=1 Tax=Nitzschia inconspicua TaxID=303405 RepID=A0A9K3KW30_9STRA|nr:hypothetical protein IV203_009610 [Nitzschia inconspicua]
MQRWCSKIGTIVECPTSKKNVAPDAAYIVSSVDEYTSKGEGQTAGDDASNRILVHNVVIHSQLFGSLHRFLRLRFQRRHVHLQSASPLWIYLRRASRQRQQRYDRQNESVEEDI